ncbi:hypothetical protein LY90DRAFT_500089 [Neocallimastix californiae]|uniref:Uncharacterized protein n=1 Tax=Neocallimastix californiae TaxID=1754190 RepID=A0A1Y2FCP4_9FUNG|nr:hypothetical protein LY90DRAFT_500089 [Neocallimastix californiae]|eukprot:ORY81699.1 hypothetical protein LY90DRAFT_500089 [Neocallimastix californiae]
MGKIKTEKEKIVEYSRIVIVIAFLYIIKDIILSLASRDELTIICMLDIFIEIAIIVFMNQRKVKVLKTLFSIFLINLIIKTLCFFIVFVSYFEKSGIVFFFGLDAICYLICTIYIKVIIKKLLKNKDQNEL